jgi:putative nucleotidyltransferase with HDIG domain
MPGTVAPPVAPLAPGAAEPGPRAATLLHDARTYERAGQIAEAIHSYEGAIAEAEANGNATVLAEALRRLAVVLYGQNRRDEATARCRRSYELAVSTGHAILAAEALNTLAGFEYEQGSLSTAREMFHQALTMGGACPELRARVELNLGILATIQGDVPAALQHYLRSLEASRQMGDERGCAIAYHNLGMLSVDQQRWDDAERYFEQSRAIAERIGDVHLQGLCLLNHCDVHLARQHYESARESAEAALRIFDRLGARLDKGDAYKILGIVYRETGRLALAESRFQTAIAIAVSTGSVLNEAEASRELAKLYQLMGRNQEALRLLNAAHRLFRRLDARGDMVDVAAKRAALEETFLAVVRDWGQSIESADSYTHGHCERVAAYALRVARALGLDESQQTTIRLGAYLHDVGKVRVPHEILNKPGPLTREELEIMQMHPIWGIELLATVEFPWDIKPIIRWHHEKYDGSGYPDRLRGDEIPVAAQIICIADVYDALTTTRSYRPALPHTEALRRIHESRHWWRPDVLEAFLLSVGIDPAPGEEAEEGEGATGEPAW